MAVLNDRIKECRLSYGMTLLEVAEYLGIREATMQRYESGLIKTIKYDIIVRLAELFHCTPSYLMGWGDYPPCGNIYPMPKMNRIPLIGKIACGTPILAEQNINEYVDMPKNIHADFALECKGDSMIGARIHDGDIVYIREQPDVESGEIAAVLFDNQDASLKRVRKYPGKIILFPENPGFEPLIFAGEEIGELRILGKAVAFTSTIK